MSGLGDRLREARTAKGFTLDDLQLITKIQKRYLLGIENEDYSIMPGSFYVRAFIKQYADAVGLDADEMLLLYKDSAPSVKSEEEQNRNQHATPTLNRSSMSRSRNNRFSEIMPKITVALFIIVIIVVVYFLYKHTETTKPIEDVGTQDPITMQDSNKTDPGKPAVKTDGEDKKDEENAEKDTVVAKQTLEHVQVAGETSTYSLTGTDTFSLEIRTKGASWISVLDSSKKERMTPAREMAAGEKVVLEVADSESVRIRVGQTPSAEIYVNGELLEYTSDRVTQNILIEYKKE